MNSKSLAERLAEKSEEMNSLLPLIAHPPEGVEFATLQESYRRLDAEVLHLERQLAAERQESYAVPWLVEGATFDFTYSPKVLGDPLNCVLVARTKDASYAVLQFRLSIGYKWSGINDEVLHGYPLYERGLRPYGAFVVERSTWIDELQKVHAVHSGYAPEHWNSYTHYLLTFKDGIVEIAAKEFKEAGDFETRAEAMDAALAVGMSANF